MNFKRYLPIWLIFLANLYSDSTADEILTDISNHFNGLDRSMVIESNIIKKGKIKKSQKVKVQIHWQENSEMEKLTFIEFLKPKRKLGVKFWEHTSLNNANSLKWMTMPVTGELKDISKKKSKKNDFDFSDLHLTKETISEHQNSIIEDSEKLIIEAISKKNKQKKHLYIDKKNNFIYKVETFSKKNKLMKSIECIDFQMVDNYKIASKVIMEDYKKKHTVEISISDFQFQNYSNLTIFQPKGK